MTVIWDALFANYEASEQYDKGWAKERNARDITEELLSFADTLISMRQTIATK